MMPTEIIIRIIETSVCELFILVSSLVNELIIMMLSSNMISQNGEGLEVYD